MFQIYHKPTIASLSQLKMKLPLAYKLIFLGFIILFVNFGKLYAKDGNFSKNTTVKINAFSSKNTSDRTPFMVENDLEFNDAHTFQQNFSASDNTTQSLDLLLVHHEYFSKKIAIFSFLLYFPIKRYVLNCIFLI